MDEDDNQYEDAEEELQELEETEYEDDKHQQNSRPDPDPERVKEIGLSGARVSRQDMLRINVGFNQMLKVAKGNKVPSKNNPANILLSSGPDSRCKESLITKALKTVNHILEPNPPTMISANLVGPDYQNEHTQPKSTSHKQKKPAENRRKPSKAASFSKLIDESFVELGSPPPSPDPPQIKLYTEADVKEMLLKAKEDGEGQKFKTSTPGKDPSPISKKKVRGFSLQRSLSVPHRVLKQTKIYR